MLMAHPQKDSVIQAWSQIGKVLAWQQATVSNESSSRPEDAFSDEALVEGFVRNSNQQHFRMLIARYQAKVHSIALSVLGPARSADAEEVAQEVFIRLYRKLDAFRGESKFSTWLYRMTFNQAIDQQRRVNRHHADSLDDIAEISVQESAASGHQRTERAARVQAAIEELPQSQRVITHLYYWLGYKTREIAEVIGTPENTVKVYLGRARAKLAELLENEFHD